MYLTEQPEWFIQDPSKLKGLIECPRRYFFEHILGWRSAQKNVHLVFGTAWHEAQEHILLTNYSIDEVNKAHEKFLALYREAYSPEWDEINTPKNPQRAKDALVDYSGCYLDDHEHFEVLKTEEAFEVKLGRFTLHGRIDSINRGSIPEFGGKEGMFSLEHKTGTRPSTFWDIQWDVHYQPALYTYNLYDKYGVDNVVGVVMNGTFFPKVKDNSQSQRHYFERYPVLKSPEQIEAIVQNAINWFEFHERQMDLLDKTKPDDKFMKAFPCNPGNCTNYGKVCPYHDFCTAWPNPLRYADRLPAGLVHELWNPLKEG